MPSGIGNPLANMNKSHMPGSQLATPCAQKCEANPAKTDWGFPIGLVATGCAVVYRRNYGVNAQADAITLNVLWIA